MMPLCTTATPPWRWGWAFSSDGRPWVAQRVCPMPVLPASGDSRSRSTRFWSFPLLRWISSPFGPITATPAESYPRYSSRRRPPTTMSTHGRGPTYPTIPHTA